MRIIGHLKLEGMIKIKTLAGYDNMFRAWADYSSFSWDTSN